MLIRAFLLLPALIAAEPVDWDHIPTGENTFTPEWRDKYYPRPKWKPDFAGIDKSRVHPAPEPGVHPRVHITPADLPELRKRLKETKAGQIAYKHLEAMTDGFFFRGKRLPREEVKVLKGTPKLDVPDGDDDIEARDPDAKEDDGKVFVKSWIEQLADGSAKAELFASTKEQKEGLRLLLSNVLVSNALRARIDDDAIQWPGAQQMDEYVFKPKPDGSTSFIMNQTRGFKTTTLRFGMKDASEAGLQKAEEPGEEEGISIDLEAED